MKKKKIKECAQKYCVIDRVEFIGRATRAEMWHLYKTSQICVLSSKREYIPGAVIECFAAGIPVVAISTPGVNEADLRKKTYLLVKTWDKANISDAVSRLLKDSELREQIIKSARKTLDEKFSWKTHSHALLNFFELICKK